MIHHTDKLIAMLGRLAQAEGPLSLRVEQEFKFLLNQITTPTLKYAVSQETLTAMQLEGGSRHIHASKGMILLIPSIQPRGGAKGQELLDLLDDYVGEIWED